MGTHCSIRAIFLDGQIPQLGRAPTLVMDKADAGDERFDDVDLLEWRNDQQLQVQLSEQLQPVLRRFVRSPAEGFIDHYKTEGTRLDLAPLQSELIGQARRQHRISQLLLLPAGLAAGIGIVLMLAVVGLAGLCCNHGRGPNHDPTITSLDAPASVNAGHVATYICAASDPDGDTLTYEWKCTAGSLFPNTGDAVYWTAPDTSGPARVWVTVQDNRDGSDVRYDTVTVIPDTASMVDWSGAVPAGDYKLWYNYVNTGYTVSGTFSAHGQEITFLVVDSVTYSRWRFNESCDCDV